MNPLKRITTLLTATTLAVAALGLSPAQAATDASTVTVKPSQLNGWQLVSESNAVPFAPGSAVFVTGPDTAPAGTGSLKLTVSNAITGELAALPITTTRFVSLTKLTYATYAQASAPAASLQFNIDLDVTDAITAYQGRLVFDPALQSPTTVSTGAWQQWDALAGKWWATSFAGPLAGFCSQASPCTLAAILTSYPNIGVHPIFGAVILKASAGAAHVAHVDDLIIGVSGDNTAYDFEPEPQCTSVCFVNAATGSDNFGGDTLANPKKSIQAAIDAVSPGGVVRVFPGAYSETAANRTLVTGNGPHQFGLFVPSIKSGISVIGVNAANQPITSAADAQATITTNSTSNFGPSGVFVEGDNVTLAGLRIDTNIPNTNKTIEVIGDAFTLRNNDISDPFGSVYINDFRFDGASGTSHVKAYRVDGNLFLNNSSLDIASGAGASGPLSMRVIANNVFSNTEDYPVISFNGAGGVPWFEHPVGGALIYGNVFTNTFAGAGQHIRARGAYNNAEFSWSTFWTNNTFNKAVVVSDDPIVDVRTFSYVAGSYTFTDVRRIGTSIQAEHDHALSGDTVIAAPGEYAETLTISTSISIEGPSAGVCARDYNGPRAVVRVPSGAVVPLNIKVDNVSVDGFTFDATGATAPWIATAFTSGANPRFDNLRFANNTFIADAAGGLYLLNQDRLAIDCNVFNALGSHAVFLAAANAGDAGSNGAIYRNNSSVGNVLSNFSTHNGAHNNLLVENNSASGDSLVLFNARNARVTGNTFTPSGTLASRVYIGGGANGVVVDNNRFNAMRNSAVLATDGGFGYGANASITVTNNSVTGDASVVVTNSAMIVLRGTGGASLIGSNQISYTGATSATAVNGVAVDSPSGRVAVSSNTIRGNGAGAAGLAISDTVAGTGRIEASFNAIDGFARGVSALNAHAGITVTRNDVAANSEFSVANDGAGSLNAECNWHGAQIGPRLPAGGGAGTPVSTGVDFSPWLQSATLTGACAAISDLIVSVSAPVTQVNATEAVSFTFTITNTGAETATQIVITNTLGSGSEVITQTALAPGAAFSVTRSYTATFANNFVTDAVTVSAGNDPITSNNAASSTVSVILPPADVRIAVSATPTQTVFGRPITYTIVVSNSGPSIAGGVVVTALLPLGVTPLSASLPYSTTGNAFRFTLGTMPVGVSQTITLVISAPADAASITTTINVDAFNDPAPTNNVISRITQISTLRVWLPLAAR